MAADIIDLPGKEQIPAQKPQIPASEIVLNCFTCLDELLTVLENCPPALLKQAAFRLETPEMNGIVGAEVKLKSAQRRLGLIRRTLEGPRPGRHLDLGYDVI